MANQKRIPFIPKLSREFKPMQYRHCESEVFEKQITRSTFMRFLAQQPCPKGQVFIDFDDGVVYLFPFESERAAQFTVAYGEFETEYKRFYREQEAIRAGRRMTVVHLDQFDDSEAEGGKMQSTWLVSEETPESVFLSKEHDASFAALSDSDRDVLLGYISAGYNARGLARRLGKDASGVTKLVKRAASRLQKIIDENC